jgi:thiol-disulfide isomerase/thioredoxin
MRTIPLILAILMISTVLAGCSSKSLKDDKSLNISVTARDVKIYFYYSPNCFACQQVKPYMNLLSSELKEAKFDICNVKDIENCSMSSLAIMKMAKLQYIPTAVVKADDEISILVGSDEVLRLGELLEKYGIETPNAVYKNVSYDVEYCISCHKEKGIPPPSKYSCTYCCHMG